MYSGFLKKSVYLFCALVLLILLKAGPALSATVTMEYQLGFNGLFQLKKWTPITVTLENRGRDIQGTLEIIVTSGSEFWRDVQATTYSLAVELPSQSKKLCSFTVLINTFAHPLVIRLRQKETVLLAELKEGGGTDLYPPLKDVYRVLKEFKAAKKHVIVLSDGMTEKGDFKILVPKMLDDRITISTVSVGSGADINLMRHIAQWGGGRAYFTEDPDNIPRIFTDETKIVSKKFLVEKQMKPSMRRPADLLQGITADLPMVEGQVLTYAKPDAQILIDTEEGPLLAITQYGLGRSAAFTSDLSGRWSKDWVRWPQFGRFAAQMVRWTQRETSTGVYLPTITKKGGQGSLVVDIINQQNIFVNQLDLKLKVLFPSGRDQVVAVSQIAPGRYQGFFPAEEIGDYYLNLYEADSENAAYAQVFGFGVPYTEEFANRDVNTELLAKLSNLTNGKLLSADNKDFPNLFRADAGTKEFGGSLWTYLVVFFMLVLTGIVVLRKLWIE